MTNKTILVADDDRVMRTALSVKLRRLNFTVLEAVNGQEALEAALRERPHLILLDLLMPKMDGMTVLKNLRADSTWGKSARVVILTNLSSGNAERLKDIITYTPLLYIVKSDWNIADISTKAQELLEE